MNSEILRFIRYLSFKMSCLQEQEEFPLTLDVELCEKYLSELEQKKEEKVEALKKAMPKNPITKKKEKPKVVYKKDGSLSSHGVKWFETLRELKLPEDTTGPVTYIDGYEDGNPNSTDQVKSWLFGLGAWGDDLGVEKPAVENWTDVTYEQMRHRCESDVMINWLLWQRMKKRLEEIYGD
jgi:hypothetical protein